MGRNKDPNRPKSKVSGYSFFVKACHTQNKICRPRHPMRFVDISRNCAKKWKIMTAEQKAPFLKKAAIDRQRFKDEMAKYVVPVVKKECVKKKRQPREKDPDAPKRNMPAFFWYSNKERDNVREMYPEYRVGAVAKELGRRWANVDHKTRQFFVLMAQKDKERYQRETKDYKAKKQGDARPPALVITLDDSEDQTSEKDESKKISSSAGEESEGKSDKEEETISKSYKLEETMEKSEKEEESMDVSDEEESKPEEKESEESNGGEKSEEESQEKKESEVESDGDSEFEEESQENKESEEKSNTE